MKGGLVETSVPTLPPPLKLNEIGAGAVDPCPNEKADFCSTEGVEGALDVASNENGVV